jgi:hypothetical protein
MELVEFSHYPKLSISGKHEKTYVYIGTGMKNGSLHYLCYVKFNKDGTIKECVKSVIFKK